MNQPVASTKQMAVPFDTVVFVLFSIIMLCLLFIGVTIKSLPPLPGGIAILLFGATMHYYGFRESLRQQNTPAACIIGLFLMFWTYCGCMLILMWVSTVSSELLEHFAGGFKYTFITKEHFDSGLKWIEPPLAIAIIILSFAYLKVIRLFLILLVLAGTVAFLWAAKTVFPSWAGGVPWVVGILGICSIITEILQLKAYLKKKAEAEAPPKEQSEKKTIE